MVGFYELFPLPPNYVQRFADSAAGWSFDQVALSLWLRHCAGPSVWNSRIPHVCSKLKTRLLALPGFYYALMNFVRMALSNYNCIVLIKWRYTYSNDSGNERSLRPLGPKSMETEQGTRERALVVLGVEPCAAANHL